MLDPNHSIVAALRRMGLKLSIHCFLKDDTWSVCLTAHDPIENETYNGRSKSGSFDEALRKLACEAGLDRRAN
jgi:hypothetical protein